MELQETPVEIGLKFTHWKVTNREVKVLLVASSNLYAEGLQLLIDRNMKEPGLNIQIVETLRGERVLELSQQSELKTFIERKNIDLVLLTVLPDFESTVLTGQILRTAWGEGPILWLDMPNEPQKIIKCIETQANGFILDNEKPESFCSYLVQALNGEVVCPPQSLKYIFKRLSRPAEAGVVSSSILPSNPLGLSQSELTRREQEVLSAIASNLSNRQIAAKLSIELCTVKNHVHHIMEKLQVNNRQEAVRYCQLRYQRRES